MRYLLVLAIALGVGCHGRRGELAGGDECHGLGLGDCRLAPGCKPDLCDGCICDISFRGCLATTETPTACPALGCPSGICCTTAMPCDGSAGLCTPPGAHYGCGPCNTEPGDCVDDAECQPRGATLICEPVQCGCSGQLQCVEGCIDDTTCGEGLVCNVTSSRCVAPRCAGDTDCPTNFGCSQQACARLTCVDDNDCDGYCVEGACYGSRGQCMLPTP